MITHNGTYLPFATHHGMPIYAATMGGKMVIGGWLLFATQQAIVAAFGAEGTEVIAKTNDYLNQIALTDTQRAQQLAMFINEDPLHVTSLVETSKTRWLVGDGKAWIDTGVIYADGFYGENLCEFEFTQTKTGNYQLFGINGGLAFGERNGKFEDGMANSSLVCAQGITYTLEQKFDSTECTNKISHVGELKRPTKSMLSYAEGQGYILFASRSKKEVLYPCYMSMSYMRMQSSGANVRHFIPCQHDNQAGMLDIISGTFYPNANTEGSFTIAITDKTHA